MLDVADIMKQRQRRFRVRISMPSLGREMLYLPNASVPTDLQPPPQGLVCYVMHCDETGHTLKIEIEAKP